jgi:hypothetical protein
MFSTSFAPGGRVVVVMALFGALLMIHESNVQAFVVSSQIGGVAGNGRSSRSCLSSSTKLEPPLNLLSRQVEEDLDAALDDILGSALAANKLRTSAAAADASSRSSSSATTGSERDRKPVPSAFVETVCFSIAFYTP